jgi:hypothetical protein
VWTKELGLPYGSETLMYLEKVRTDFTENLRSLLSVVEVEIDMWSAAAGTDDIFRNP